MRPTKGANELKFDSNDLTFGIFSQIDSSESLRKSMLDFKRNTEIL